MFCEFQRKLRTVQRAQEMSQNQKSLEEDRSTKICDDEFRIDLTLQKASSCSEEDTMLSTANASEIKHAGGDTASAKPSPDEQQAQALPSLTLQQQAQAVAPPPATQQQIVPPPPASQQPPQTSSSSSQQATPPSQPEISRQSSQDVVDSPQETVEMLPKQQVQYSYLYL